MDISVLGYKLNLEILILIGIVYLILVGHTFCSCCSISLNEGLTNPYPNPNQNQNMNKQINDIASNFKLDHLTLGMGAQVSPISKGTPAPVSASDSVVNKGSGFKNTEGFVGANTNYGESSAYSLYNNTPVNTTSWNAPDLTVVKGQQLSSGVKDFLARPNQPVPLPEGEMLMFANTKFAPEYCPNTYSNSSGCAAMTGEQYNYLITRGGNNVPYSEY
jgi:hypothetical protein